MGLLAAHEGRPGPGQSQPLLGSAADPAHQRIHIVHVELIPVRGVLIDEESARRILARVDVSELLRHRELDTASRQGIQPAQLAVLGHFVGDAAPRACAVYNAVAEQLAASAGHVGQHHSRPRGRVRHHECSLSKAVT